MASSDWHAVGDPVPLTPANVASTLWLGSLGLLILGIQPVVLEPLVRFGRIGEASLGSAATIEILAIALGSVVGARLLRSTPARVVAAAGLLPFAAANLAMHWLTGLVPLLALRALSGLAGGMLVGLAVVSIARGLRPERLSAAFLVMQTTLQLCVAALIPYGARHLLPADFGFVALAGLGLVSVPVLLAVPQRLAPLRPKTTLSGPVGLAAWAALAGCGAYMVGIVAVWAYFGVWEHQLGMPEQVIGTTAALSLAAQVVGAAAAGWLGTLLSSRPMLLMAIALQIAVVLGLLHCGTIAAQVAFALAFGFLWLFALPLQTRLLIDVEPSRRAVLHLAAAQLIGGAAGPSLAGLFVTTGRVDGALWTGVAVLAISGLMVWIATRRSVPEVGEL
jgi:MFS transporter, DHA1 family, inner membrane transport protein